MKILVFGGSGKMGAAVAFDLAREPAVTAIGLVGRRSEALEKARAWLASPKVAVHALDVERMDDVKALMKQYDVCVNTLPDRHTSYLVVQAAVECGCHVADMLEEYHRRPDAYEIESLVLPQGMTLNGYGDYLHETAVKNGVTFLDGIGFAPGLSNITCGEGIRKLDRAESVIARVGRDPQQGSRGPAPVALHDHVGLLARPARVHDSRHRPPGRPGRRGRRVDRAGALRVRQARQRTRRSSAPSRRACRASSSRDPISGSSPRRPSGGQGTGMAWRR